MSRVTRSVFNESILSISRLLAGYESWVQLHFDGIQVTPDHAKFRFHADHNTLWLNMKIVVILSPLLFLACDEILTSEAAVLPNFYPFGQSEGDQVLPQNDDQSSGTVPISIQFPFFDQNHNSLFVSRQSLFYYTCTVSWHRKSKGSQNLL